jgi:hypothetical protein
MNKFVIDDGSLFANSILQKLPSEITYQTLAFDELHDLEKFNFSKLGPNPLFFIAISHDEYFGMVRERIYKYLKLRGYGFFDIDMRVNPALKNCGNGGSIYIGSSVSIAADVKLKPLTTICDGVIIDAGVRMGKNVYIERHSYIEECLEIGDSSTILKRTYLTKSVPMNSRIFKEINDDYFVKASAVWQFQNLDIQAIYINQK